MIDIDALRETTEVVVGARPGWIGITLGTIAAGLCLGLLATIDTSYPKGQESRKVKELREPVPAELLRMLGLLAVAGLLLTTSWGVTPIAYFIGLLSGIAVALLITGWTARRRDRDDLEIAVRFMIRLGLAGLLPVFLVGAGLAPQVPTTSTQPSTQATAGLDAAQATIIAAVQESYDVEVTVAEDTGCSNQLTLTAAADRHTHVRQVNQIEAVLAGNLDEAPQLQVLTTSGVVGCYGVIYDNDTGRAQLIVDAKETDLPAPGELRR